MLISCPECQKQISDKAISCPNCGYPMQPIAKVATSKRAIKKYKKLPNGYGHIKHLDGRRRKPYAAYPPTKNYTDDGKPVQNPALGYFATYQEAMECLTEYNKAPYNADFNNYTLSQVYELFYNDKYVNNKKRKYSKSSINSTTSAYKNFEKLHDKKFKSLRTLDFQTIIDETELKHASLEHMVTFAKQIYKYAMAVDIVEKDYGQYVKINVPDDDEKGVPFTEEEIKVLWRNSADTTIQIVLILIYTGFRVNELKIAKLNVLERLYTDGNKTPAGKKKIVPIHNDIWDFVMNFNQDDFDSDSFRSDMHEKLEELNMNISIEGTIHTPHDCRHTFSWLADKYKLDKISKRIIMGHSLGKDVEDKVYSHRTVEELRMEIDKIKTNKGAQ